MSAASTYLNEQYLLEFHNFGASDTSMEAMFSSTANILGNILDQVKTFLNGTGLLIIRMVDYAKQILITPRFDRKIRKATQAVGEIGASVTNVMNITNNFGELVSDLTAPFLPILNVLGSVSVNLYELARDVVDVVFFGDLVFKPILSSITLPSFDNARNTGALEIIRPYINFMTSVILSPISFIKALLELLRPVWNFIKSLASGNPMRFIRAIGRLPSMLIKVLEFLNSIINAFTNNFPLGIVELIEPIFNILMAPMLQASQGLRELGISQLFTNFVAMFSDLISGRPLNIPTSSPIFGMLVPIYVILKTSIIASVNYLFGNILSFLGINMTMSSNASVSTESIESEFQITGNEFTEAEINRMEFEAKWEVHNAWTNQLGIYSLEDREEILDLNSLSIARIEIPDLTFYNTYYAVNNN